MAEFEIEDFQEESGDGQPTYADIVFVIDITGSMAPCIDKVKDFSTKIYDTIAPQMENAERPLAQLRVKVIGYRDFYHKNKHTGEYETAIEESGFFYLPEDNEKFKDFLGSLEAKGGGDYPESGLEALALAMKTDWVQPADIAAKKRHIIILFTDASAHPLEKAATDEKNPNYPSGMPKSYTELMSWWGTDAQGANQNYDSEPIMDQNAKRLHLFRPEGADPWDAIARDGNMVSMSDIARDEGGKELSVDELIATIIYTVS